MNLKITLTLVVVLVLALTALLLTRPDETPSNRAGSRDTGAIDPNEGPLISSEALGNELKRITFDGGLQGTLLQLERIDGRWRVTAPNHFYAKTQAVDALLSQLSEMNGQPAKENKPNGFVQDSSSLLLQHGDHETAIYLSNRLGAGRAVVTIKEGDKLRGVSTTDALFDLFDSLNPGTYYNDQIVPPLMPEISRIMFETPEGTSVLVQQNEQWWIGENESAERALAQDVGDYPGIAQFFKLLETIELIEINDHDTALAAFGLVNPVIRVNMSGPDQIIEIRVGAPADPGDQTRFVSIDLEVENKPTVFTVATESALLLGQSAKAFRDPRIITIPPPLISRILIMSDPPTENDPSLVIHSDQSVLIRQGDRRPIDIDQAKLATLLAVLTDTRPRSFVSLQSSEVILIDTVAVKAKLEGKSEVFDILTDPASIQNMPTVLIRRGKEPVALRIQRDAVAGLLDPSTLVVEDGE